MGKDSSKNKNLPEDRQFLITRNVPCTKRIADLQKGVSEERETEDGWITTDNPDKKDKKAADECMDIDDIDNAGEEEKKEEEAAAVDIDDDDNVFAAGAYIV